MSGICGFFDHNLAQRSLPWEDLAHRGPDGWHEVWGDGFGLGYAYLSLGGTEEEPQPVCNEDQTILLVGDIRIYNHRALRAELSGRHSFRTKTEAEVIVHLLEEEGPEGLGRLDGMFALAAFLPEGAFLARDPLGIKPLYFRTEGEDCFFASEIKAFPGEKAGVREFPAGCFHWVGRDLQPYYRPVWEYRRDPDRMAIQAELRRCLYEAVAKMLSPGIPTGVFLSGGLDSALVAAIAARGQSRLHTFSIGCCESPDRHYARLVADHIGAHHHEYTLAAEQMWEALPEVVYHLESFDYALVRSAVANFFLARSARDFAKVVLVGEGADELFGGYAYLSRFTEGDELHRELGELTAELHKTGLRRVDRMSAAFGIEARLPFLDTRLVDFSFTIPPWFKRVPGRGLAKGCLREAFAEEGLLPEEILFRPKEKFSEGTGVATILAALAEERVSDEEYRRELERGTDIRSKEEFYYFQLFVSFFGREGATELVGRTRS